MEKKVKAENIREKKLINYLKKKYWEVESGEQKIADEKKKK